MPDDRLPFGILATGNIAEQFAQGVAGAHRSRLAAVASRDPVRARAFADRHAIPTAHGSYRALLDDPAVAAVYNALPNDQHLHWTLAALDAGKHVLCEKPLACNAREARLMFDAARRTGRLLVEAFMYRSHPLTHAVLAELASGAIGQIKLIRTSFCYSTRHIDGNTRFDPAMAGGALMDIGCYCLSFARLITGEEPQSIHGVGHRHPTGVDDVAAAVLRFPSGVIAELSCAMTAQADNAALICGDAGYLRVPVPWKPPVQGATYVVHAMTPPRQDRAAGGSPAPPPGPRIESVDAPAPLYGLEADDFARAVAGEIPPAVSPRDTLGNMELLDELRRQLGIDPDPPAARDA